MPRFRRILVPLTGDALTNGHIDILKRAAEESQEAIWLFAVNPAKVGKELFSVAERIAMAERIIRDEGITNARAMAWEGLLVDALLREGCQRIFRGVRNAKDRDFEEDQASINAYILSRPVDEVVKFLEAKPELALVSSSNVKAMVQFHLDVERFVPLFMKQVLEERLVKQYKIGVTGGIAVGKSHVAKALVARVNKTRMPAKHVSIDALIRDLYAEASNGAQDVRDEIAANFGTACLTADKKDVDRACLSRRLTELGVSAITTMEEITKPHVHRKYREALTGFQGLIVLEWSQLAEMGMSGWVNGNVVVVDSPDRERFIAERGIDPERLAAMDAIQWGVDRKIEALTRAADKNHHGKVFLHQNVIRPDADAFNADIDGLIDRLRRSQVIPP